MDNVTAISGLTLAGVMHRSRDREDWRTVVARSEAATDEHGDADRWGDLLLFTVYYLNAGLNYRLFSFLSTKHWSGL